MSKDLEKEYKYSNLELLREIWFNVPEGSQKIHQKHFDLILSKLKELQAIKESKPSEAMRCLEELGEFETDDINGEDIKLKDDNDLKNYYNTIKQALLKSQEQEKVLGIIFEKNVDIIMIRMSETLDKYNQMIYKDNFNRKELTQEEFDLLKRYCDEQNNKKTK